MLNFFARGSAWAPFSLRLALGAVFIFHGAQKLFGVFGGSGLHGFKGMISQLGLEPALAWAVLVAVSEFLGGIGLVLGYFTRLWAFLIAVIMSVAILAVHWGSGFAGMEFPIALLGGALSLLLSGGGRGAVRE